MGTISFSQGGWYWHPPQAVCQHRMQFQDGNGLDLSQYKTQFVVRHLLLRVSRSRYSNFVVHVQVYWTLFQSFAWRISKKCWHELVFLHAFCILLSCQYHSCSLGWCVRYQIWSNDIHDIHVTGAYRATFETEPNTFAALMSLDDLDASPTPRSGHSAAAYCGCWFGQPVRCRRNMAECWESVH